MKLLGQFLVLLASVLSGSQAWGEPAQDEIIVTGEKRDVPLQQTVASVSVLTNSDIEERSLAGISDAFDRVVNVSETYGTSGFSIRGISNVGVTGAGEAATATIYVDGVPLASTYLQGAPTQLWDVSQIEILRGPQSTLQGLNSLAGAIIIRTVDPSFGQVEAQARSWVTDEWKYNFAMAGGGPIFDDELALRFAVETQNRDGFVNNLTRHTSEDEETKTTFRFKALWKPSSIPELSALVGYTHFNRDGGFYNVYVRTDTPDYFKHRIASDNTPNTTKLRFDSVGIELRYEIADGLALASATSWSDVLERSSYDLDFGPVDKAYGAQQRKYRTLTQELRLNLDTGPVSGLVGLYLYDRDLESKTTSRTDVPTPISTIAALLQGGGLDPSLAGTVANIYGTALPFISVDFGGSFPTYVSSVALFGDGKLRLNEHISLLAGFRFDRETYKTQVTQVSKFAGTFPDPIDFGPFAPIIAQINSAVAGFVGQANASLPATRRRFDTFLPKGGFQIDWNDRILTSFVVQRGYRSGGSAINIARGQNFSYDPEHTWNFELALRSVWLNGRLRLNANAFYTDWRDQQVAVNFGLNAFDVHTVNAGKSHLYGLEIDSDFRISDQWSIFASAGYLRTKFDTFSITEAGVISNLSGTEFAFAPEWTIAGGTRFKFSHKIDGIINAKYSSRAFGMVGPNQTLSPVASHVNLNARIGYTARTWSIHVNATNILDENYVVFQSPGEVRAVLNNPRTFGIEFRTKF